MLGTQQYVPSIKPDCLSSAAVKVTTDLVENNAKCNVTDRGKTINSDDGHQYTIFTKAP